MTNQATQHVNPFEQFVEPNAVDDLWASIVASKALQEPVQQQAPVPQQIQTQPIVNNQVTLEGQAWAVPPVNEPVVQPVVNNTTSVVEPVVAPIDNSWSWQLWWWAPATVETPEVPAVVEPVSIIKAEPKTELEFDEALADLEKDLWISLGEEPKVDEPNSDKTPESTGGVEKTLAREEKFLKIIKELDSANKKSLTRAWDTEVKLDTATQQLEYYKKMAQEYHEELRGNEFDRDRFVVAPEAKNFVHYFNEYNDNKDNTQARDSSLREAIKIVNKITGRDLNNYLSDYFTMWTANLGEIQWGSGIPNKGFNAAPWAPRNADSRKRNSLGSALSNM